MSLTIMKATTRSGAEWGLVVLCPKQYNYHVAGILAALFILWLL